MTPKEKAKELVERFAEYAERTISNDGRGFDSIRCAKQCATIAVDEIIKYESVIISVMGPDPDGFTPTHWQQVKTEIEIL